MDLPSNLPKELLMIIIFFLDRSSCFSLRCVSKFYKRLISINTKNDIMIDSIVNGHTDLYKWLMPKAKIYLLSSHLIKEHCKIAASLGHFEILKYIAKDNWDCMYCTDILAEAAGNGKIHIVKWLIHNGCRWNSLALNKAAENGQGCFG